MKKIVTMLMAALLLPVLASAKTDKKALFDSWNNYEVSTVKVGQEGTKFLKVWGYGKNVDKAIIQAKKNAIHACLFRGIPGSSTANATPAIFANQGGIEALYNHLDYFYDFFETGGGYLEYVNLTTDGVPSGQDRREVKGGMKVGIYVQVMYDNLKKRMKSDNVLQQASSGFTS